MKLPRYSLRALTLAIALVSIVFGWIALEAAAVRTRQNTRTELESRDVWFVEDGEVIGGNVQELRSADQSANPSAIRRLLGDRRISVISFGEDCSAADIETVRCFPEASVYGRWAKTKK